METELINDWRPETATLLERLQKAGFEIVEGNDGETDEIFKSIPQMVKFLTSVDDAWLCIRHPENGKQIWLFLVYGNEPGYLVNDYSVPANASVAALLDREIAAHSDERERAGQPKATREEIYA